MTQFYGLTRTVCFAGILGLAALAPTGNAQATFTVLHAFKGGSSDGAVPNTTLVVDGSGNLYGTTTYGGTKNAGTIFKISAGRLVTIYSFKGGAGDGALPQGQIAIDKSGNIFGTTAAGGASGLGTIFTLNVDGIESVLNSFQGGSDGAIPLGGVILDQNGQLFGTTYNGGGACNCGSIFRYNSLGGETVLHGFQGTDGELPLAGLVMDASENVFGTTYAGGASGFGALFKLDTNQQESVLYSFQGGSDGAGPTSALVLDAAGNFFGTTSYGGGSSACTVGTATGCGTVFELSSALSETILHAFQGNTIDGEYPVGGVSLDATGNVYGTTCGLGSSPPNCNFFTPDKHCARGCSNGDSYMLPPPPAPSFNAGFKVIHRFTGRGGSGPSATMLLYHATLYGTTEYGGGAGCKQGPEKGCGVVFSMTP